MHECESRHVSHLVMKVKNNSIHYIFLTFAFIHSFFTVLMALSITGRAIPKISSIQTFLWLSIIFFNIFGIFFIIPILSADKPILRRFYDCLSLHWKLSYALIIMHDLFVCYKYGNRFSIINILFWSESVLAFEMKGSLGLLPTLLFHSFSTMMMLLSSSVSRIHLSTYKHQVESCLLDQIERASHMHAIPNCETKIASKTGYDKTQICI